MVVAEGAEKKSYILDSLLRVETFQFDFNMSVILSTGGGDATSSLSRGSLSRGFSVWGSLSGGGSLYGGLYVGSVRETPRTVKERVVRILLESFLVSKAVSQN